jgi:hypothetical protein
MQATSDSDLTRVRGHLQGFLRENAYFLSLPREQQVQMYEQMLDSGVRALQQGMLTRGLETNVDDPTRIRDVPALFGEFIDEVDFPDFVRDLITGVYGSIVESTIQQMNAYVEMFKGLAQPLGALAQKISKADAISQVAANDPLRFSMRESDDPANPGLFDNQTNMELDTSSDEVQRMMFEAKLALAKERRLLLRETMLMGVQRLVVDQGVIRASVNFTVKGGDQYAASKKTTDITQRESGFSGGLFGLFGGGTGKKQTTISVSSKNLQTAMEMQANLTGFVEVKFRSDQFNLNNFAELFGDEATRAVIAQRQPAAALPAGAPVPAGVAPAPAPVR